MRNGVVLLYVPTYCLMWILIELEFWFTKNANPTHTYPHILVHREKQTPTPTKSKKKINNLKKKCRKEFTFVGNLNGNSNIEMNFE